MRISDWSSDVCFSDLVWSQKTVADNIATIEDTPILDYPASTIVNSTLGFRVNDNFRLQFSVRNLFDQAVPYEAQVTRQFGVYDPIGRTYTLRASVDRKSTRLNSSH